MNQGLYSGKCLKQERHMIDQLRGPALTLANLINPDGSLELLAWAKAYLGLFTPDAEACSPGTDFRWNSWFVTWFNHRRLCN